MPGRRHPRPAPADLSAEEPPLRAAPEGDETPVWSELGGYRLLRSIGTGEHAWVHLARGDDGPVVVKAYPERASDCAAALVECLCAVSSPHVVRVLDVAVAERRPVCVILERLEGALLSEWLRLRDDIDAGEAVTVCVGLVRAVSAVHEAGWSHGSLSAARVRFDAAGCPVLLGFGRARRATAAGLTEDWAAVSTIAQRVLGAVVLGGVERGSLERVTAAFARLEASGDPTAGIGAELKAVAALEEALFALGPVAPIAPAGERADSPDDRAHHVHRARPVERNELGEDPGRSVAHAAVRGRRPTSSALGAALVTAMEHGVASRAGERIRVFARARRRPILIAVSAAAAITCALLVVVPDHPSGRAETARPPTTPVGTSAPWTAATGTPRASAAPTSTSARSTPAPIAGAAVDEGAVRAASRLLAERSRCIARDALQCLSGVDQLDSPIASADSVLITGGGDAPAVPAASRLSLVETLGDAAVVAIAPESLQTTKPASLLLVRTEAGWRLRALFEN